MELGLTFMPRAGSTRITPCAIALASSKGGTSKTTCTANLCVRAAQDSGAVVAIDLEPQQSLARWFELRKRHVLLDNPRLLPASDDTAAEKVAKLKRAGAEWIFLDLPPGDFDLIEPGIAAADFVIVPVKASPIDLEAIDPIIEICEDLEKAFCILLTQYDEQWNLSKTAIDFLDAKWRGRTLKEKHQHLGYRQAYVGAMIAGQTGPEYNLDKRQAKAAGLEVDAIWAAVKKLATAAVK